MNIAETTSENHAQKAINIVDKQDKNQDFPISFQDFP